MKDKLNSVPADKFSAMVDSAHGRIKKYAEVKTRPESGADWGDAVKSTQGWSVLVPGDRVVYSYDPKAASCSTCIGRA